MAQIKKEAIIALFNAKKSGSKGWYLGDCPHCKKPEHLGLIFNKVSSFACKRCGEHGNLYQLLKHVGRLDLWSGREALTNVESGKLPVILDKKPTFEISLELPEKTKPLGFNRIFKNEYLESRGFIPEHFEHIEIGTTIIDPIVKNEYIIFCCFTDGICTGWLGRSIRDKKWIDNYNREVKEYNKTVLKDKDKRKKYLRWINSVDTDFSKMLFGYDEIKAGTTETVIIVEGVTSKCNVDKLLRLWDDDSMKCVASFGKKLSPEQIQRLLLKGVRNIILLYDPDAVKESKTYSFELSKHFNVEIGYINFKGKDGEDKDPGDLTTSEILTVMNSLENPVNFFVSKIQPFKI